MDLEKFAREANDQMVWKKGEVDEEIKEETDLEESDKEIEYAEWENYWFKLKGL